MKNDTTKKNQKTTTGNAHPRMAGAKKTVASDAKSVAKFDVAPIFAFLRDVAANNNRPWFMQNKARYEEAKALFDDITRALIVRIAQFDPAVAHLDAKDCIYRFYRDVRFSQDKSPYKRHFGAFVNARGKNSLHCGYYLHLQPEASFLAAGTWCLPSNILKEVRLSIVEDLDTFRSLVEEKEFHRLFPTIGYEPLKTLPKGFPKDFPFPQYLRPRIYSWGYDLDESFFQKEDWLDTVSKCFSVSKPLMDFLDDTIDDYDV